MHLQEIVLPLTGNVQQFLNTQDGYVPGRPKAYVNWILLDEQLKFVQQGSGAEQVPDESEYQNWTLEAQVYNHLMNNMPVTK